MENPIDHQYCSGPSITQSPSNPPTIHKYSATWASDNIKRFPNTFKGTANLGIMAENPYALSYDIPGKFFIC